MNDMVRKITERTLKMPFAEWTWGEGVAFWCLNHLDKTENIDGYQDFLKGWVDKNTDKINNTINGSIPCISAGEVYKFTNDGKYKEIVRKQADFLMETAPRLDNGALVHTDQYASFGKQMWADTLFMAGLFLVYASRMLHDERYLREALNQFKIHVEMLQVESGLFYHGYDEGIGKHIGLPWGRANAWVTIGIMEMLDYITDSGDRKLLIDTVKRQLDGLKKCQLESGLFRTVLNGTFSYEETSCAYGFGCGILKGVKSGVLDESYLEIIDRMKNALFAHVADDGMILGVSAGTPVMRTEPEYEIICNHRIQYWGQGLALLYFCS